MLFSSIWHRVEINIGSLYKMQLSSLKCDFPVYGNFCLHYMCLERLSGGVQIRIATLDPHENK